MRIRLVVALSMVVLVATAPVAALAPTGGTPTAPATDTGAVTGDEPTDLDQRPDPNSDQIGWENGYWYDDEIAVDQSDGLNQTELDAVVARAMARVEQIRQLEFQSDVPVRIISRETYREQVSGGDGEVPTGVSLHQNAKFEALFMIGEDTDAIATQQSTLSASVLGYYSPSANQIVIVSENTTSPKLDEITLSQELFHALQDQVFNAFETRTATREDHNAYDGIIEGDGNYVDYLYEQRCGAEWSCLLPQESSGGGGGDIHLGLYLLQFQPYSDGPAFVQQIREAGGWEAVNAVYENPPASTEQTIHPDKYGTDPPTDVTVEDTSTDRWHIPETGGVPYAEFGEAGVFSMLMYPSIASSSNDVVLNLNSLFNYDDEGDIAAIDPYNYVSQASAGWDGDKLYPYATDSSAETNQTGYVWKLVWDSETDAEQFVSAYEELLGYHSGTEQAANLWVIEEGDFADAFYISVQGDTTTIVNAPTVEELSEIRTDMDIPQVEQPTTTQTTTVATTTATETTATTTSGGGMDDPTTTSGESGPGFGVIVTLLAGLTVALIGLRMRR